MQTIPYRRWSPPRSPLRIEFPADLLQEIGVEAPREDANGVLYGWRQGPDVRLLAARACSDGAPVCPPEQEQDPRLASMDAIGIFVRRIRGDVFLRESDLELFDKRKAQVALVAAGDRAGFFVKEADGSFQTIRSYEEFSLDGGLPRTTGTAAGASRPRPAPAHPKKTPASNPHANRYWQRWSIPFGWAAALAAAILAIPIAGLAYLVPLLPPPGLALAVQEREGQLMITWNPRSVSAGAQIEISDGVERSVIPLWPGQSSATYGVRNGDVEVSLTSNRGNYESARFLTRPVGLRPSVEVQATRAEVAQLESQLQQLRRTAEQGRARIKNLDRLIGRLTPH
jgi:hypothetical protein